MRAQGAAGHACSGGIFELPPPLFFSPSFSSKTPSTGTEKKPCFGTRSVAVELLTPGDTDFNVIENKEKSKAHIEKSKARIEKSKAE